MFVWVEVALLGLLAATDTTAPRSRLWILGAVFAVVAWGTSFTGFLLPWDQLALRAITIGADFVGLWKAAFSHEIRFVLIDNREISQHLLRNWFLTHSFVLPPLLVAGLVALRRGVRD